MSEGFYTWATISTHRLADFFGRPIITGVDNVPATGGLIVSPNHLHFADPPVISAFLPRQVRFMVKQEAWDAPLLGLIPRGFNAFPVRRGEADVGAYRTALQLLRSGQVLGIFPEGHRSPDGRLQPGQPGAVVLARRARVPILPIGIWGVKDILNFPGILRHHELHLVVGEPYDPPPARPGDVADVTAELMARLDRLLPPEHRAPAARPAGR